VLKGDVASQFSAAAEREMKVWWASVLSLFIRQGEERKSRTNLASDSEWYSEDIRDKQLH